MGDYTKLTLRAKLAPTCSDEVQQALSAAISRREHEVPAHEFFKCARWQTLLGQGRIVVADDGPVFQIEGQVKNYDQEICKLCDWLSLFLSSEAEGSVVGAVERLEFMNGNDVRQLAVHEGAIIEIH